MRVGVGVGGRRKLKSDNGGRDGSLAELGVLKDLDEGVRSVQPVSCMMTCLLVLHCSAEASTRRRRAMVVVSRHGYLSVTTTWQLINAVISWRRSFSVYEAVVSKYSTTVLVSRDSVQLSTTISFVIAGDTR